MAGQWHENIVSRITRRHHAFTTGFRQAWLSAVRDQCRKQAYEDETFDHHAVIKPDAYLVEQIPWPTMPQHTGLRITAWEVELSHPLDHTKISRYAYLWGDLDASDLLAEFHLVVVDRFGNETEVDLVPFYYELVLTPASEAAPPQSPPPPSQDRGDRDWERLAAAVRRAQRKARDGQGADES